MRLDAKYVKLAELLAEAFTVDEIRDSLISKEGGQIYTYKGKPILKPAGKFAAVVSVGIQMTKAVVAIVIGDSPDPQKLKIRSHFVSHKVKVPLKVFTNQGFDGDLDDMAGMELSEWLTEQTLVKLTPRFELDSIAPKWLGEIPIEYTRDGDFDHFDKSYAKVILNGQVLKTPLLGGVTHIKPHIMFKQGMILASFNSRSDGPQNYGTVLAKASPADTHGFLKKAGYDVDPKKLDYNNPETKELVFEINQVLHDEFRVPVYHDRVTDLDKELPYTNIFKSLMD